MSHILNNRNEELAACERDVYERLSLLKPYASCGYTLGELNHVLLVRALDNGAVVVRVYTDCEARRNALDPIIREAVPELPEVLVVFTYDPHAVSLCAHLHG